MSENEVIENRLRFWTEKNNAGEGFDPLPGHECATYDDIDVLAAELGPCVYEARRDDDVSVFRRADGAYTLVGNAHGPWGVTVAGGVK